MNIFIQFGYFILHCIFDSVFFCAVNQVVFFAVLTLVIASSSTSFVASKITSKRSVVQSPLGNDLCCGLNSNNAICYVGSSADYETIRSLFRNSSVKKLLSSNFQAVFE